MPLSMRGRRIGVSGGSAEIPIPETIAGLVGWFDGSDATTLFQDVAKTTPVTADGQAVKCWADKSASGFDFSEYNAANNPIYKTAFLNSKSVVQFSTDALISANVFTDSTFSLFAVIRCTLGTTGNQYFFSQRSNTNGNPIICQPSFDASERPALHYRNDAGTLTTSTDPTVRLNSWIQIGATGNGVGGTQKLYVNKSLVDSDAIATGAVTLTRSALGAEAYTYTSPLFTGEIAELIIYDTTLSDTDRQAIENYITDKWGI